MEAQIKAIPKVDTEKWEWNFEAENVTDYKLEITFHAKNKLLMLIFDKAKEKLKKKKIDFEGNPKVIDAFKIDTRYLKLLGTAIRKQIATVHCEIKKDNIEIMSHKVVDGEFRRNKNNQEIWDIMITVKGQYADKR